MTVAALPSVADYLEDGVTTVFPAPFRFKAGSVIVERILDGAVIPLLVGVDYSVAGGETDAGGSVTRAVATNGAILRIRRSTALAQPMVYTTGDRFPAVSHEEALDRQMLIAQEQEAATADLDNRALLVPVGEGASTLPIAAARKSSALVFDEAGDPTVRPIGSFPAGPPGASNNTYETIAGIAGSATTNKSATLAPTAGSGLTGATYTWKLGNYTGRNDVISSTWVDPTTGVAVPIGQGAWVLPDLNSLTFRQRGIGSVTRPAQAKQQESVSVMDFGAKGDGVTDDADAINRAIQAMANLTAGSRLVFPRADYLANDRLLVTVSRLALFLDGCRIIGTPWRYNGSQSPFGSFFVVTGKYCDVSGTGQGNSLIQLTGGSEANGITFLHTDGGSVSKLTIDGGKEQVTAPRDDTFMTPLHVLNATGDGGGGNPSGVWSRVLVREVELRNAAQYNAQAYGDLGGLELVDSHIHSAGIANQPESRGAGVAVTRGNRAIRISRCLIEDNKQDGIFQTSAGLESFDLSFSDNTIRRNGRFGITCTEESNFASVAGVGTNGIIMKGNKIRENGGGAFDTTGGVRLGTFDGVGQQLNVTSTDDILDNVGYGAIVFTNDHPTNRTSQVNFDGKISGNTIAGIGLGAKLDDTIRYNGTKIRANTGGDIANFGDSRLVSNSRGQGASVASASTITVPSDGDLFLLTGSTTVRTISADPGRTITLVFGGSITVAKPDQTLGGNVVMAADFAGQGNSTLQLTCVGGSWFKIAGSVNA